MGQSRGALESVLSWPRGFSPKNGSWGAVSQAALTVTECPSTRPGPSYLVLATSSVPSSSPEEGPITNYV